MPDSPWCQFRVEPISFPVADLSAASTRGGYRAWRRSAPVLLMMRAPAAEMTRHGSAALWMLWACLLPAWSVAAGTAVSSSAPSAVPLASAPGAPDNVYDFAIASQPLGDALSLYGITSSRPAIFMSDLLNGRTSSAVQGRYTAEVALRLLLAGTGLEIEKISSRLGDSFLLKQASPGTLSAAPTLARFFHSGNDAALIQQRIMAALCADKRTAPGNYRALFQFELNAAGRLEHVSLLSSSDDHRRDGLLLDALRGVQIDTPLPPALTQQVMTMRLRPDAAHAASSCHRQEAY